MINNADKMLWIEGSSPQKFKNALTAIDRPWNIVDGSYYHNGFKWGCWVLIDVPVAQTRKRKPKVEKKISDGKITFKEEEIK